MNKNGLKLLNKTAFSVVGWMTAIVAVVAWRSNGNMLAVCLASGLPIGVVAFWVIVNVKEASIMDPRVADRVAADMAIHKPAKAAKIAAKKAALAEKEREKMLAKKPAVSTHAVARKPISEVTRIPAQSQTSAAHLVSPSDDSVKPARQTSVQRPAHSPALMVKQSMVEAAAAMEAPRSFALENVDTSGRFDFLDEMNYLYTPTARGRKTLDLFGSGKILNADEEAELENGEGLVRPVSVLEIDREK
jgi:hypothetical protein